MLLRARHQQLLGCEVTPVITGETSIRSCATVRVDVTWIWGHLVTFCHWRCWRSMWNFTYLRGHYQWGTTWQECEGLNKTAKIKSVEVHLLIWMVLSPTVRWLWFTCCFIKTPFFQRREWLELVRAWQMEFLPCFSCFLFKRDFGLCVQ